MSSSMSSLLVPVHTAGPSSLSQAPKPEGKTPSSNFNQPGLRAGNPASGRRVVVVVVVRLGRGWAVPTWVVCLTPGHKRRGVVLRKAPGVLECD